MAGSDDHTSEEQELATTQQPSAGRRRSSRGERGDGLSRQVTVALRQAIITGVLEPGERLTEDGIAEEHGVSRIPVREAFRALEVEGFVTIEPFSGTFVARLSDRDAADLLEVRQAIEVLAISRAAARRTEAQILQLEAILEAAGEAFASGATTDLVGLNGRFHIVLAEASGNATIVNLLGQLRHKVEWVYAAELDARARDSWDEHGRIVESIRASDPFRASALMQAHITNAEAAYQRRATPDA